MNEVTVQMSPRTLCIEFLGTVRTDPNQAIRYLECDPFVMTPHWVLCKPVVTHKRFLWWKWERVQYEPLVAIDEWSVMPRAIGLRARWAVQVFDRSLCEAVKRAIESMGADAQITTA